VSRWQRYWFADGGRLAAAYVRVAIAMAVLMSLTRLATLSTVQLPGNPALYRPVGIWMVLGYTVPPDWLITILWAMAWAGSVAMLLGLATRAATAVSFVGAVSIAALSFATKETWSHQYNVVFLAQLAFLGARGGDVLSLDAVIRRLRGLPPLDVARGYQWSLRLVQLAIALMFAGAVFHKLLHGHFTLRWATSDNLRHHLLMHYDLAGLARPALVDWILEEPWRYRTVAGLNLLAQLLPIFACVFIRRPIVRALCGAVFVAEVLGLGLVVSLWNEHWLPLAIAFIDWDRLNHWLLRETLPPDRDAPPPPRARRLWILVFVLYDLVTAFVPAIDQKLNTYPFSGFPMFATIRAAEPYDEHLPYSVPGDKFVVLSDHPLSDDRQQWLDHVYRGLHAQTEPGRLENRLRAILATLRERYPELGIHGLRHQLAIFEAAPYPAPARFDLYPIAVTGEISADGTFRTMLGTFAAGVVELRPRGLDPATATLTYFANDRPISWQLAATRDGNRFTVSLAADPVYIVATVAGTPWLVATRRSWKWQ
jgi:hypothetical protein